MSDASSSVAASADPSRPNVLVIVMDCVRAPEFSVGSETLSGMPYCTGLARESIDFRRAVAPASWTIPSHASLFTGLYPWDHRLHSRGAPQLPAGLPDLAASLSASGYRTASFSSNPFVSDLSGLTRGFETAAWGGWWERYARHLRLDRPPGGREVRASTPRGLSMVRKSGIWPATL
ncbi:MAG: sulfatase-like hydrolase/transferase, partial [Thermoplasmata archaeon]|nr:sulfatase-like hydrolase/transferase [Thermoplasmata archaeon]